MSQSKTKTRLPKGWTSEGSNNDHFEVGVDMDVYHTGSKSGFVKSKSHEASGFGTLMQGIVPGIYSDKRVRLTAWVKTEDVRRWAGLWMRVTGADKNNPLAFDNMSKRPITGTTDWTRYVVVLDVAREAQEIAFGILLTGPGAVWVDEFSLEEVGPEIPTTNPPPPRPAYVNDHPINLAFEDG